MLQVVRGVIAETGSSNPARPPVAFSNYLRQRNPQVTSSTASIPMRDVRCCRRCQLCRRTAQRGLIRTEKKWREMVTSLAAQVLRRAAPAGWDRKVRRNWEGRDIAIAHRAPSSLPRSHCLGPALEALGRGGHCEPSSLRSYAAPSQHQHNIRRRNPRQIRAC